MLQKKNIKCTNCGYEFSASDDTRCPRCNAIIYVTLKTCENCNGCFHKDTCNDKEKQVACKK